MNLLYQLENSESPSGKPSPFDEHVSDLRVLGSLDIDFLYMMTAHSEQEKAKIFDEQRNILQNSQATYNDLAKFYKRHELYFRIRGHEKAHYWQTISTSYLIIRLFRMGDSINFLGNAIKESLTAIQRIRIPLRRWLAKEGEAPESLERAAQILALTRLFFQIADGSVPDQLGGESYLQYVFANDKAADLGASTVAADPLGARALLEGAAKASEWIYWLIRNEVAESEVIADLSSSLPIYKTAFIEFVRRAPEATLLEALQAFVVSCDYALTTPVMPGPDWAYSHELGAENTLPGVRFRKIMSLWKQFNSALRGGKEEIYGQMAVKAKEAFGWSSPAENCSVLAEQIKRSPSLAQQEPGLWNQVGTLLKALQIRSQSPCVFVAPVDAAIINQHKLVPPEIGWDGKRVTATDQSALTTILFREINENLVGNIYDYGFLCPLRTRPLVGGVFACDGKCVLSQNERNTPLDQCLNEIKSSHQCVLPELVREFLKIPYSVLEFAG